jgi:hypothetical protein
MAIPMNIAAALSRAVSEESAARKAGISGAAANSTRGAMDSTAKDEVALGQDYGRMREEEELGGSAPIAPRDRGIRDQVMAMSSANGDSTDELRNYSLMMRARRQGGPMAAGVQQTAQGPSPFSAPEQAPQHSPEKAAQLAELTQAGNTTSADIMAGDGGDAAFSESVDSYANAYADVAGGDYTPAMREKERRLAELERAGASTVAQISGAQAPGTKSAIADQLTQRANQITAQLSAPPAVMPSIPQTPQMQQPPQMPQAGLVPAGSGRPMASFPMMAQQRPQQAPLVPPVAYPPSPAYPQAAPANTQELDAAANYARFRLGM